MSMLDRREFLTSAAAIPALGVANFANAAGAASLTTEPSVMEMLVKLRGSLDGKIAIWWMRGPRYGVTLGAEVTPLFDNLVTSFQRFVRRPDGNFDVTMVELSYYTDINTGEWLHHWRNPYTGEQNDIEHIVFGPITSVLTPQGATPPVSTPGVHLEVKPRIGIIAEQGDDVWVGEDVSAIIRPDQAGRSVYHGNDLATYHGSAHQLRNARRRSADATIHYQSVTNWRTWMKMEDRPGYLMARGVGRKVWRTQQLPDALLKIARLAHPRIIADPIAALSAPQPKSSFQR